MTFPNPCPVEMLAFGREGEVRNVKVPDSRVQECQNANEFLEAVFYHGQNEVQPQRHPSVSAGDVKLGDEFYLYAFIGVVKMNQSQYDQYRTAQQYDRIFIRRDIERECGVR